MVEMNNEDIRGISAKVGVERALSWRLQQWGAMIYKPMQDCKHVACAPCSNATDAAFRLTQTCAWELATLVEMWRQADECTERPHLEDTLPLCSASIDRSAQLMDVDPDIFRA